MSRPMRWPEPARFTVRPGGGRGCPVVVGAGAASEVPAHVARLDAARVVIITDSNVEGGPAREVGSALRAAGMEPLVLAFPAGEASKSRATKEALEDRMIGAGCGRDTAVVAVGGGVAGDLAGFVAATYMRGVPHVQVPTSLLAMADASIGGKTGVDHPSGKNLIGAFHQPSAVLADPSFLATLPPAEFRSGLAEIAKAAVVGDARLFEDLEAGASVLAGGGPAAAASIAGAGPAGAASADPAGAPLARAVRVKVDVVSADERESDLRQVLNFGHTIGHALEAVSGYAVLHGEAVAAGMVVEAALAVRLGLMDAEALGRIRRLLGALGLPVRPPAEARPDAVLAAAGADKKARGGRIRFALPAGIGTMARGEEGYGFPVDPGAVLACLGGGPEAA
jgi:3-dehydroquinate synthase